MMLSPAEQAQKEAALKLQQEQQARENAARVAELAQMCAQPSFQRVMLGKDGYVTGLINDAENVLLDERKTPVNDLVIMAVHLTRWRDARALHAALKAAGAAPPAASV